MAFGAEMMSRAVFEPTDPQVALYLAGEEISVPESCKGYTAVMLRVGNAEITLGGGKASGGRLKNYYPKGLRVR
jgi:NOL1/NOP2/fmu family ribosome biogenesis protein